MGGACTGTWVAAFGDMGHARSGTWVAPGSSENHQGFERLAIAARIGPPRVRAMLGALGERLGGHAAAVERLRGSLNPLSRYEFGIYAHLPNASA